MSNVDKKISEIEEFVEKSNQFVADVLKQLDENKRNMEAMGWTEERFSKMNITPEDRRRAIKVLTDMGHGDLFNDELITPAVEIKEPDAHIISVSRTMGRRFNRFNMI